MSLFKSVLFAMGAAMLAACATSAGTGASAPASLSAEAQVQQMNRGVNVLGYDPLWQDPARARFHERHMQIIHEGGFQTVRIVLQSFRHMDADNTLNPQWFATLDRMVNAALANHLTVILDEHDYGVCGEDPAACRVKLAAFWRQVGEHYKDAPPQVIFELLNEPNHAMDAQWNDVLAATLAVVRQTNPTRNVIIGPAFWNNINWLDRLQLPENDRHIIVTVHYYLPMEFTHQGAPWVPEMRQLGVTWGSAEDRAFLKANFDGVKAWSEAHHRPIFLGEFGAYDRAPLESRVAYTSAVAREAEAHGFAWAYWQFDSDFVVWDMATDSWNAPIHDALIPH
ncbi:MAG TPA: glycoside hydrolase family 5 protein [Caulobacterales bacterium]|nr:glycoside hydrolase family 5 protein [Caulobacterales bacterium]